MKILLTGGGTGGHFYPIASIIEELRRLENEKKLVGMDLVFVSDSEFEESTLFENRVRFIKISSGKVRRYFSLLNITDTIKTGIAVAKAIFKIYQEFPDVIFSKGGYASFPVVLAARIFGIPLVIHESDAVPGAVNKFSGKFAKRVAISFPEAAKYFSQEKTALTGNPIRKDFFFPLREGAKEYLKMEEGVPIVMFTGGSQGSQNINDVLLAALPNLLEKFQIIHQTGKNNFEEVKGRAGVIIENSQYKSRYHVFDYLNRSSLRMAYGVSDLAVSRAGAGSIFEIAASGLPSVLIPLNSSAQNHQRENAYSYASTGAADVLEEANLTPNVLLSEVSRLVSDKAKLEEMKKSALVFAKPKAAEKIAEEILNLALEHSS